MAKQDFIEIPNTILDKYGNAFSERQAMRNLLKKAEEVLGDE